MVAIPMQVLISMCWFSVYCSVDGDCFGPGVTLVSKKGMEPICAWLFHCELYVGVL